MLISVYQYFTLEIPKSTYHLLHALLETATALDQRVLTSIVAQIRLAALARQIVVVVRLAVRRSFVRATLLVAQLEAVVVVVFAMVIEKRLTVVLQLKTLLPVDLSADMQR